MLRSSGWEQVKFGEASSIEEYFLLWGISALLRPKAVLEIGTSTGIGAAAILGGASVFKNKVELLTIDVEDRKDVILANFKALGVDPSGLRLLVGDSRAVVPVFVKACRKFDFVFIDGCHEREFAFADWKNTRSLTDMWILHDSTQMGGVRELVEHIRVSDNFDMLEFSRYPFGHQYHEKRGGFFAKGTIPGITLVRRKGTHLGVGVLEQQWLKENKK